MQKAEKIQLDDLLKNLSADLNYPANCFKNEKKKRTTQNKITLSIVLLKFFVTTSVLIVVTQHAQC
jgi:hypothetical protein